MGAVMCVKNRFLELLPGVPCLSPERKKKALQDGYAIRKEKVEAAVFDLYALGAETAELEKMYDEAEALADQGDFQGAFDRLKQYKTALTKAEKDVASTTDATKKNEIFKIRYEKKKERVEQGIKELKVMPGTGVRVKELETKLRKADVFAQQESFEGAYNAMSGYTKLLREAVKESSAGISNLPEKKNLKMKTAYNAAMAALAKFEVLFPDNIVEAERNKIMAAAEPVLQARTEKKQNIASTKNPIKRSQAKSAGDKKMLETAALQIVELNQITADLKNRTASQAKAKNACDTRQQSIESSLNELVTLADADVVIELQDAFAAAKKLAAHNDYRPAVTALNGVRTKVNKKLKQARADKRAWDDAKPEDVLADNKDLKNYPVTTESYTTIADEIKGLIDNTIKFRGYAAAFARLETLKEQIRVLRDVTLEAFNNPALDQARDDAKDEVYGPFDGLQNQITILKLELKKAGGAGELPDDLKERIDGAQATWEKQLNTVTAPEALAKAKADYLKSIADLDSEIDTARKTPATLQKLAGDEKKDAQRKAYETARADAKAELAKLAVGGGSAYDLKLKEYKTLDSTAGDDYTAAKTKMETLKGQVAGLLLTQTTNLTNKKSEVETKADSVERLIKLQRGKAGRAFKDFFDDLANQAKDIRSLSTGGNLDVLELCLAQLVTLEKDVTEMANKAAAKGPDAQSFKAVLAKISAIRKKLKDKLPAKVAKKRRKELLDQLGELSKEVKLLKPEDALKQLKVFESEVDGDIVLAAAALKKRKELELKYKAIKQELTASGVKKELVTGAKSKLYASLKGRLKAAAKQAKTEGQELDADSTLDQIRKDIAEMAGSPLVIAEKEREAIAAVEKKEAAKREWDIQFKNYDRDIIGPAEKAVSAPGGDASQIDGLKDLEKEAKRAAKAGDFEKAMEVLESAKARSKQIVDNPQGAKKTARSKLPQIKKSWAEGVRSYETEVENLAVAIETWVPTELTPPPTQAVMTKAATEIRELTKLFEAQSFDTAIDTLAGEAPPAKRKAEREKALGQVRRFVAALERDKVVAMVLDNPFQKGVLGACNRLLKILGDVEENVLISV